ncbi:hypothetical protein E2C01_064281 [Portunus trituberculatus]|uniref:Uncharacterized protein n=1 Tax=Portunus trituberculatus TaxID=210409 RepID=A0A5B7HKE3_PORTR|nr:hypothetical protein [Portunus trituberculatus]
MNLKKPETDEAAGYIIKRRIGLENPLGGVREVLGVGGKGKEGASKGQQVFTPGEIRPSTPVTFVLCVAAADCQRGVTEQCCAVPGRGVSYCGAVVQGRSITAGKGDEVKIGSGHPRWSHPGPRTRHKEANTNGGKSHVGCDTCSCPASPSSPSLFMVS